MIKIMLVEDDKSLREIYGVRLLAEGYDIVSAGDGEEALAMAIKERPQLILSDVMMPKISGFDMLDILRSTTETRNIKVIMMTALSSEEQRLRGEQLGADRYLVKSQVGIEDVVRVVHEVLEDRPVEQTAPAPAPAPTPAPAPQPTATAIASPTAQANPTAVINPVVAPIIAPPQPVQPAPTQITVTSPPAAPPVPTTPTPQLVVPPRPAAPVSPTPVSTVPKPPSIRNRIIQPLNDPSIATVDLNDLLDKELAKEAGLDQSTPTPVISSEQEKAIIDTQLDAFKTDLQNNDDLPHVEISPGGELTQEQDDAVPTPPTPPIPPVASMPATQMPQPGVVTPPAPAPQPTATPTPAVPPLVVPERPAPPTPPSA